MNKLSINAINLHSPYIVGFDGKALFFTTDNEIAYRVEFELDNNPYFTAYWFNLANPDNIKSPNDNKIAQTIICIIEEFFNVNPEVLLYMCSTDQGQQAQRARLFLRCFNSYRQQQKYALKSSEVKGEGRTEYVALIVKRDHPQLKEIIDRFDEEVEMFNELKP